MNAAFAAWHGLAPLLRYGVAAVLALGGRLTLGHAVQLPLQGQLVKVLPALLRKIYLVHLFRGT